jgi:hypothetical protein
VVAHAGREKEDEGGRQQVGVGAGVGEKGEKGEMPPSSSGGLWGVRLRGRKGDREREREAGGGGKVEGAGLEAREGREATEAATVDEVLAVLSKHRYVGFRV